MSEREAQGGQVMEIQVETAVRDVVLYPDRARVTVAGRCEVTPETRLLLVDELPLVIEPDSVRVGGGGTARVRILSVDVVRRHYTETPAARVRELETQIEALEDQLRQVADDKAGWLAHAVYLDGLRQATAEYARGLARGKTGIAEQEALIAFLQAEDAAMRAAQRELDQRQRDLNRQVDKLRQELKQLQAARPRQRFQGRIEVQVQAAGTFEATVAYVVRQAGWRPLYDVRLQPGGSGQADGLTLTTLAEVYQNTGQAWTDVALTVSTARPALNQRLPELQPWFIDEFRPAPAPQMVRSAMVRPAAAMAEAGAADAAVAKMEMAADEVAEAEVAVAEVKDGGTAVSFVVPGKSDVPSDGSPHKTTISQLELGVRLDYLVVPKHTDAAYRRATVVNSGPGPWLGGQANLFVGDEFIGRTLLAYTPQGEERELLLGVEERIAVERELVRRDVDKQLLRDNRQLRYAYEIRLKNLLPGAAQVEVQDQLPVARHEQIKVKLEEAQPAPAEQSELQLLKWRLNLAAGQAQTIRFAFAIGHPRGMRVVGLVE
ncbi:MAG: mucoidy inhibitor MuiA family protein [Anaerolineales bacterium]|nr:mucoidy inhibitor MuiA family protein [Anaerolineales bacterium]